MVKKVDKNVVFMRVGGLFKKNVKMHKAFDSSNGLKGRRVLNT